MKRSLISVFFSLSLLGLLFCTSSAGAASQRVFDFADLYSESQILAFEETIESLQNAHGADIVLLTITDAEGKSPTAFADDYYDESGFGVGSTDNGVLFLIDMDNRQPCLSTHGDMIYILTDTRIDAIFDLVDADLAQGDFAGAASSFLQEVAVYLDANAQAKAGQNRTASGPSLAFILTAAGICALIAILGCVFVFVQYHHNVKFSYSYPFRQLGNLDLRKKEDVFSHHTVTKQYIPPKSTNGGTGSGGGSLGRSSTRTSSSGRTHGGRSGRKF